VRTFDHVRALSTSRMDAPQQSNDADIPVLRTHPAAWLNVCVVGCLVCRGLR